MARVPVDGLERMRALVAELPTMLVDGFRTGREVALPFDDSSSSRLYACGLGGSGAAADLAASVLEAEGRASLEVVHGEELPRAVDARATVVIVSYSGGTTEAIAAYAAAGRRDARRLVVASGGPLAEQAADDSVPVVRVPAGLPPRAAFGHLFGGLLGALDPVFLESTEQRVRAAAESVRGHYPALARRNGAPARLAASVGARLPFVLADRGIAGVGRRWATQIEENAKRLAVAQEVPEMLHNAIVGWEAMRPRDAARCALIVLERPAAPPSVRDGLRHLTKVVRRRRVPVLPVDLAYDDPIEAIVQGVAFGDLFSLELARRDRVDPYPIVAIERLRAAVAAGTR